MSLGLSSIEKAREIILKKYKFTKAERKSQARACQTNPKILDRRFSRRFSYWDNRGISSDTLSIFKVANL